MDRYPIRRNPDAAGEHYRRSNPAQCSWPCQNYAPWIDLGPSCWSRPWVALAICALAFAVNHQFEQPLRSRADIKTALYVVSDWLHLVAGGIWIGGLLQLVLLSASDTPTD